MNTINWNGWEKLIKLMIIFSIILTVIGLLTRCSIHTQQPSSESTDTIYHVVKRYHVKVDTIDTTLIWKLPVPELRIIHEGREVFDSIVKAVVIETLKEIVPFTIEADSVIIIVNE